MQQQHETYPVSGTPRKQGQSPQQCLHDGRCHVYDSPTSAIMEPVPLYDSSTSAIMESLYDKPWAPQLHDSPTSTMAPLESFARSFGPRQPRQDWVSSSPALPATASVDSSATLAGAGTAQGGPPSSPITASHIAVACCTASTSPSALAARLHNSPDEATWARLLIPCIEENLVTGEDFAEHLDSDAEVLAFLLDDLGIVGVSLSMAAQLRAFLTQGDSRAPPLTQGDSRAPPLRSNGVLC